MPLNVWSVVWRLVRTLAWAIWMVATCLVLLPGGPSTVYGQESVPWPDLSKPEAGGLFGPRPLDPVYRDVLPEIPGERPVMVVIELTGEPSVQTYARTLRQRSPGEATAAAQAQLAQVEQAQQALTLALAATDAAILYRTQRVYNGIAVVVSDRYLAAIEGTSGVQAVHPLILKTVQTVRSVPFIGAPQVWQALGEEGLTGRSISIGIIDTGIDYLHRDFGGPGEGYGANDTTVITEVVGGVVFPTAKVVGGYDFAGDNYDADSSLPEQILPTPDPDPMDCHGHGTHVAGIAAGRGVTRNGVSYTGPYEGGVSYADFLIGPGVAPEADLYALKVFGCIGSTALTDVAIEWAVDPNGDGDFSDRLDVINLSLGTPFGSAQDPTAVALDNATLAGVVVVAAAGNKGDTYYIGSSPGTAGRAITVASSTLGDGGGSGRAGGSQADGISTFSSRGPRRGDAAIKPDIAAPGEGIVSALAGSGRLGVRMSGTSMATPHVAGALALLRQLRPGWSVEELKALAMNTAHHDLALDPALSTLFNPGRTGAGRLSLARAARTHLVAYDVEDAGLVGLSFGVVDAVEEITSLKNVRIANRDMVTRSVYVDYAAITDVPGATVVLPQDAALKLAPGGVANVPVMFMADPSSLGHTIDPTTMRILSLPRHWISEETGHLRFWSNPTRFRAHLTSVGTDVEGRAEFEYGPDTQMLSYTVAVSGTAGVTLTTATLFRGANSGHDLLRYDLFEHAGSPAGATAISGQIPISATDVQALLSEWLYVTIGLSLEAEEELQGRIELVDPVLRLPMYAAPRPAASMQAVRPVLAAGKALTGTLDLELAGQGVLTGGTLAQSMFPTDTVSLVSVFELQFSSPNEFASQGIADNADLKYVGVTSNLQATVSPERPAGNVAEALVLFAIATYGEWSTPNEVSFEIYIDNDEDGVPDYVLANRSVGEFLGRDASDEFMSLRGNLADSTQTLAYFLNGIPPADLDTRPFDTNVLFMAVDAAGIGLTEENTDFRYFVAATGVDETSSTDRSRTLYHDVARPGLEFASDGLGGWPIFFDMAETTIPVTYDRDAYWRGRSQGVLLLHHHNQARNRAEVVGMDFQFEIFLPFLGGTSGAGKEKGR